MQTTVAFKPAMAVRAAAPSRASRPAAARPAAARAAPVAARTAFLSGSVAGSAASVRFVGKASGKAGFRLVTAMAKKSVGDLTEADLKGKVVFERADLNVPLDKGLNITDDTRIRVRAAGSCAGQAASSALGSALALSRRACEARFVLARHTSATSPASRAVRLPRDPARAFAGPLLFG
jgi:hypothetical protein